MTSATVLKKLRLTHHYSGVFFAPTILFFAITGSLQMFGLHETSRGSSYIPPALLVHLAQLHKKGTVYLPQRRAVPSSTLKADSAKAEASKPSQTPQTPQTPQLAPSPSATVHNPLPMKVFFALTAFGLAVSTLTGLYMAWKYTRRKRLVAGVFLAGIAIPLLLLLV